MSIKHKKNIYFLTLSTLPFSAHSRGFRKLEFDTKTEEKSNRVKKKSQVPVY